MWDSFYFPKIYHEMPWQQNCLGSIKPEINDEVHWGKKKGKNYFHFVIASKLHKQQQVILD